MNPLSSHPQNNVRLILMTLVVFLLGSAFMSTARPQQDIFLSYGFAVSGFSAEQKEIILQTLDAYAEALGSREQLRKLITHYNQGKERPISFRPDSIGANSDIELTPTVFSLEKAKKAHYSTYATLNEEKHAKIVIGHEIGHLVFWDFKARTGIDLAKSYGQRVTRNWQMMDDSLVTEQEAVTELSLYILKSEYYMDTYFNRMETNPETLAQIKAWAKDILEMLRQL